MPPIPRTVILKEALVVHQSYGLQSKADGVLKPGGDISFVIAKKDIVK